MSVMGQIRNSTSVLGGFLRQEFPYNGNRRLLGEINRHLGSHPPICRLESGSSSWIHGLAGHAVDHRIRYHFAMTPSSEFTMARNGAFAVTQLDDLIDLARSDPSTFSDYAITQLGDVPEEDVDWRHFLDSETHDCTVWVKSSAKREMHAPLVSGFLGSNRDGLGGTNLPLSCTLEFFDLLDRTASSISAHRRMPTSVEECRLARLCLVLAVFESVGRSGRGWPPEFLRGKDLKSAESLLQAIPQAWVEDVAALARAFSHRHADWQGAPAILNPVFAGARDVGGADGDLIVDNCLWDIKTTIQKARGRWLHQLLAYVLLDYDDEYAIKRVGLLFPRQGSRVRWEYAEFVRELSGNGDVSIRGLREELRRRLRSRVSKPATSELRLPATSRD